MHYHCSRCGYEFPILDMYRDECGQLIYCANCKRAHPGIPLRKVSRSWVKAEFGTTA